jgi:hypothetical protein
MRGECGGLMVTHLATKNAPGFWDLFLGEPIGQGKTKCTVCALHGSR